jgi:O-antigen/teichoic acid export membrane protein
LNVLLPSFLKQIGLFLVVIYCLLGSGLSLFSQEIIMVMTAEPFWNSYKVMPFIAFNFVATGIYYLLVNILFYVTSATKYIAISTGLSAISNILLNWLLIPKYGIAGAAIATLFSQIISTIFTGIVGNKYEKVSWNYLKFIFLFFVSISTCSIFIYYINLVNMQMIVLKILVVLILFIMLNFIAWNEPLYLARHGMFFIKKMRII